MPAEATQPVRMHRGLEEDSDEEDEEGTEERDDFMSSCGSCQTFISYGTQMESGSDLPQVEDLLGELAEFEGQLPDEAGADVEGAPAAARPSPKRKSLLRSISWNM